MDTQSIFTAAVGGLFGSMCGRWIRTRWGNRAWWAFFALVAGAAAAALIA